MPPKMSKLMRSTLPRPRNGRLIVGDLHQASHAFRLHSDTASVRQESPALLHSIDEFPYQSEPAFQGPHRPALEEEFGAVRPGSSSSKIAQSRPKGSKESALSDQLRQNCAEATYPIRTARAASSRPASALSRSTFVHFGYPETP